VNITLSADPDLIARVRSWAQEHGTSLNALIREDLERLVGSADRKKSAQGFKENALSSPGRSQGGNPSSRKDLYAGKRFS
jgi:hypothetical protein